MKKLSPASQVAVYALTFFVLTAGVNCATTGLVSERYPQDFYRIPGLLLDQPTQAKSTFILYGDNQGSWRIKEKFLRKSNWTNTKMLIFPFYQLYLVGGGLVGAIDWLRHSPGYGSKERHAVRDAVHAEAIGSKAAFILNLGDMVADDGRRPSHWGSFLKENKIKHPLLNEIPYLPVIGNHEHANNSKFGSPNYQTVFGHPRFYVVEMANAVIFILDSNYIIDQYQNIDDDTQDRLFEQWFVSGVDKKEPAWLEEQLAAYDKGFKMVAMHHPPLTYAMHHCDWTRPSYGRDLADKRKLLLGLLEKHGVDVVFSGHDHLYQHNLLRYGSDQKMHFVVSGGGGGPLRDIVGARTESRIVEAEPDRLVIRAIQITEDPAEPTRLIEEIVINQGGSN
jgi:hypothetical protein